MTFDEALETTRIWSASGLMKNGSPVLATRPFRAPHHTVSDVAMVGGGTIPRPGEISLSHHGVLFLDELPEFRRNVLEVLRQPLQDRELTISRAAVSITYPSSIMLVAACNPCPCGFMGDPTRMCTCAPSQIHRYRTRVSGPLLDRIDIHIEVPAVPYRELSSDGAAETSEKIRERVVAARDIQLARFSGNGIFANAQMRSRQIRTWCKPSNDARKLLEEAMRRLGLSARAYTRILKVARTIADLDGKPDIGASHVAEAIQYRTLDRELS